MTVTATSSRDLQVSESVYLDLLRSSAAVAVLLDHAPVPFNDAPRYGHVAVIVFFVLSDYIISAVSVRQTPRQYIIARLSRLWSVLVPALLLTAACDFVGHRYGFHPEVYLHTPADMPFLRLGAMLVFLSQSWVSIQPLSDFAAWSLCLEFWYYATFAAMLFVPKGWWRYPAIAATAFMSGPMGLALMPLWFVGVLTQRRPPANAAWMSGVIFFVGIVGFIVVSGNHLAAQEAAQSVFPKWLYLHLDQARTFFLDWVAGAFVAANLAGARAVAPYLPMQAIARPVRWCAGLSFAAYLFHEPLYLFWSAFLPKGYGWIAVTLSVAGIIVFGIPAERSKIWWKRWMLHVTKGSWSRPKPA